MFRWHRILRSKSVVIEIMSKPDCCLCDQAQFAIDRLIGNMGTKAAGVSVKKINIQESPDLEAEYSLTIPVILIDGEVVSESRYDIPAIRKYLDEKLSI